MFYSQKQLYLKFLELLILKNERKHKNDDRGALDLSYLIEQHKAEIWEYKQKEADWKYQDTHAPVGSPLNFI